MPDDAEITEDLLTQVLSILFDLPDDIQAKKEILKLQEELKALGPDATKLLLQMEPLYLDRVDVAIRVALRVGVRAGTAQGASELPSGVGEVVREMAFVGMELSKEVRLSAIVEVLRLELMAPTGESVRVETSF